VHIDSLPLILVLHLKRFLYDANAGGVGKVGKQVSFTPELEIGNGAYPPALFSISVCAAKHPPGLVRHCSSGT